MCAVLCLITRRRTFRVRLDLEGPVPFVCPLVQCMFCFDFRGGVSSVDVAFVGLALHFSSTVATAINLTNKRLVVSVVQVEPFERY